jgi:transcriptional antiterminator NusG
VNEASPITTDSDDVVAPESQEIEEVDASSTDAEEVEVEEPVERDDLDWYVVHVFSGYENKARAALEERIRSLGKQDSFGEILVPEEEVVERTKTGATRQRKKRFYPGYILVQMDLDSETWHIVKNTPKVTGFVGGNGRTPPKVPPHEVAKVKGKLASGTAAVKPKMEFEKGETVHVIEGPFANFNGVVDEVRPEKGKLRVMVSIFGRATPVELDFMQVKKT